MNEESEVSTELVSTWLPWILAALAATLTFAAGRRLPLGAGEEPENPTAEHAEHAENLWTCSMHPQIRQPAPGNCPICGMDLIPLGNGGADETRERVVLSSRAATLARIRTVSVERIEAPAVDVRLLGRIEVDENRVRNVAAWIGGRVDNLFVRETGVVVKRGQVIAKLYSPEVYAAHQDLLSAAKQVDKLRNASEMARGSAQAALASARERLSLLGVLDAELNRMAKAKSPSKSVPIRTTHGGTVMERLVTQGQYVETGTVLYRTADLTRLWVQLDAYESDLPALTEGQTVEIEVAALPGESFSGEVSFIDPLVDPRRRVSKVRVEVDNEQGKLRPGMFVEAVVRAAPDDDNMPKQKPLVIPETAPLFTGRRSVVYVEVPDTARPTYEPRPVELGPRMGHRFPVLSGLSEGERVVESGAFVLDADLQLRGGPSMMAQPDDKPENPLHGMVEMTDDMRAVLGPVVRAYLEMQVALADDDWQTAKAAAARLSKAADVGPLEADANTDRAWNSLRERLQEKASIAAQSAAIEDARGAFRQLSMDMASVLQVFGNPLKEPIRLAYCPMANANQGAEWFQATESVQNSYFGESMLNCGDVRDTIEPGQHLLRLTSPGENAAQGGHQH